jgi:hypothetical protein
VVALIGLLGLLLAACAQNDIGSTVVPTSTAPTPTAPTPPASTNSVPVISHLTANFSTNSCTRAADGLTAEALEITFDYNDGSGDLSGGHVHLERLYNTGRSEFHDSSIPSAVTLIGTPTVGQLRIGNACPLYDNATSSTETLTLIDASGLASNSLSITVTRPAGDR